MFLIMDRFANYLFDTGGENNYFINLTHLLEKFNNARSFQATDIERLPIIIILQCVKKFNRFSFEIILTMNEKSYSGAGSNLEWINVSSKSSTSVFLCLFLMLFSLRKGVSRLVGSASLLNIDNSFLAKLTETLNLCLRVFPLLSVRIL